MKKTGKCLVVVIFAFFIVLGYRQRYRFVNEKLQPPDLETYDLFEEVEFEKDILINDTMEGYSIKVNRREILTYPDFLAKYHAEDEYTYVPEKIYDVEVVLKNVNADEETGINLSEFYIQGLAVCASLDTNLYNLNCAHFLA